MTEGALLSILNRLERSEAALLSWGFVDGGFLRYRYRGTDPNHRDNVGLRTAMQRQTPLIYLHGIVQGLYEPAWPVFIVEDHPESLTFIVAIDDQVDAPAVWQFSDPAALLDQEGEGT